MVPSRVRPPPEAGRPSEAPGVGRPLAALALAVVVFLQIGTVARPLGDLGGTRAADWLDLLTPWAVVGAATWVLLRARPGPQPATWALLGIGAVAFAEGGGLHLAANSVSNAGPTGHAADVAYLWDETVSHWIWYVGLLLVLAAVTVAVLRGAGPVPRTGPVGLLLAAATGFSLANTWIEGRTPWLGLAAAVGFLAVGLRHRRRGGLLWVVCFGLALVQLVGWGTYWWLADGRVFPEYYEVFDWL